MADAGPRGAGRPRVTRLGYDPRSGGSPSRPLAALAEPPTAVVVANVNAAHGALLEARRLGLRVPEDLSIVAIHDAWTAENAWPPLTTVRMPLYELGSRRDVGDLRPHHGGNRRRHRRDGPGAGAGRARVDRGSASLAIEPIFRPGLRPCRRAVMRDFRRLII